LPEQVTKFSLNIFHFPCSGNTPTPLLQRIAEALEKIAEWLPSVAVGNPSAQPAQVPPAPGGSSGPPVHSPAAKVDQAIVDSDVDVIEGDASMDISTGHSTYFSTISLISSGSVTVNFDAPLFYSLSLLNDFFVRTLKTLAQYICLGYYVVIWKTLCHKF